MSSVKCFFRSVEGKHNPVELAHGKEVIFGRGPESKIYENRCSRKQMFGNTSGIRPYCSFLSFISELLIQGVNERSLITSEKLRVKMSDSCKTSPLVISGDMMCYPLRKDFEVKIIADCKKREVEITQLGRNASAINGMSMSKDQTITAKERDRVELLIGQFAYVIEFDPPAGETSKTGQESGASVTESTSGSRKGQVSDSEEEDDSGEPKSKKSKEESEENDDNVIGVWESVDEGKLLVYTHPKVEPSTLIASYDLDSTLIGTKTGVTFPKNKDDWKILYPAVLPKLKEMYENKFKIVIFTNQATLSSNKANEANFKNKIENVVKKINVPIQVFVATSHSYYRKPAIGMWDAMKERNGGLEIDMEKSFYCGDAAGREAGGTQKKKDFSHSDLLFAKNLNLHFETPEYHFLNKEMQPLNTTVFDPNTIPCDIPLCTPSWGQIISNRLELIILVGCPGSGKSHFVKTHLIPAGYVHVNRDTLGSWSKCVSVMETALKSKQRVVVDNTNPDVESRKRYITVARNYTSFVRCFIMNTSFLHAKHNNRFRQLTDPSHAVITDLIMNTYKAKYKEPALEEGFSEILRINFWPTFKDPKHEKLYKLFLLEK